MKRMIALAAVGMLALAGCSGNGESDAEILSIADPWLKATEEGVHMTGAFGTLTNETDKELHLVEVSSPVTERVEYHEMIGEPGSMVMSEMPDGIRIPAGESFELMPGGNHIMLMELMEPIEAGEKVEITVETADGETFTFEAEARTFSGANEEYAGDDGMGGGMENMSGEEQTTN